MAPRMLRSSFGLRDVYLQSPRCGWADAATARLVRSGEACLLAELTSLVEQDPCPGGPELAFVPSVVVGTEEQLVVPLARDEQTYQHIGSGAATIAPIGR